MKRMLAMSIAVAILSIVSTQAIAETVLISSPLPPGENGFTCACTNLSKNDIEVGFHLVSNGGASYDTITILSGYASYVTYDYSSVRACKVSRVDDKTVKKKDLACTFSAIDANGNPTASVPVDLKFKE